MQAKQEKLTYLHIEPVADLQCFVMGAVASVSDEGTGYSQMSIGIFQLLHSFLGLIQRVAAASQHSVDIEQNAKVRLKKRSNLSANQRTPDCSSVGTSNC